MTDFLIRREKGTEKQDRRHVETEAETEVMLLRPKKHNEPPETRKGKEGFSPTDSQGRVTVPALYVLVILHF